MRRRRESMRTGEAQEPEAFLPLPHLPFHVLLALADAPRHGWGVVERIGEIAGERACPSSGSLYLAMQRLEERGLIQETPAPASEAGGRRRYFALTPLGRRVLAAETQRLAALVELSRGTLPGGGDGP